jgi:NodT family efflux transporter outer membrane factor (OMF) lipoprotein
MIKQNNTYLFILILFTSMSACKAPSILPAPELKTIPKEYSNAAKIDSASIVNIKWNQFFTDKQLVALIDTALQNNLDVLTTLQEIEIAKNKIKFANGKFLPSITGGTSLSVEKVGRFTSQGAGDASTDITPGTGVPDLLPNLSFGFQASWEADIWGKLKSAQKATVLRYLSSEEGKKLVVTNLIAEISNDYYELVAQKNQLEIVRASIGLQQKQLELVKVQKETGVVSSLAVKQFEAQLYNTQNTEYNILQNIVETENKINLLLGRYPQTIKVNPATTTQKLPILIESGVPSQLLNNRPDIKQAELELQATNFDVKAARAEFYPSFNIGATLGFSAFKPAYLLRTPESMMYSLVNDITGPIVNKSAIKAAFNTANAQQIEALYSYQKSIINGYIDVSNQLSNFQNLNKAYELKNTETNTLKEAVEISSDLFKYGKATYLEVLTAQRDALNAQLELIDFKKQQLQSIANVYKALGGGWQK